MKFERGVLAALVACNHVAATTDVVAPEGEGLTTLDQGEGVNTLDHDNGMEEDDAEFWERFLGYNYW